MFLPTGERGFRFHSFYNVPMQLFELHGVQGDAVVQPLTMSSHKENEYTKPFIRLRGDEAQGLMDTLWQSGLRPSTKEPVTGIIEAKDEHIKDLRKVAFNDG